MTGNSYEGPETKKDEGTAVAYGQVSVLYAAPWATMRQSASDVRAKAASARVPAMPPGGRVAPEARRTRNVAPVNVAPVNSTPNAPRTAEGRAAVVVEKSTAPHLPL